MDDILDAPPLNVMMTVPVSIAQVVPSKEWQGVIEKPFVVKTLGENGAVTIRSVPG